MKHVISVLLAVYLIPITCLSQKEFAFSRKVQGITEEGWYAVPLPDDMFRHLNYNLSDIRIYTFADTGTTEVPYLLDIRTDKITSKATHLPVINKSHRDGKLYLTFTCAPGVHVNYLELRFKETNYFGFVTIEGSHDQKSWFEIVSRQRILSIENEHTDYELQKIHFPESNYTYLRLSIEADKVLTFESASFRHRVVEKGSFRSIPVRVNTRHDQQAKRTIIDLTMDHPVFVSRFSAQVLHDIDYYRNFTITCVTDSVKRDRGWVKEYHQVLHDYLTSYSSNTFELEPVLTKEIRLVIDNHDNPPLIFEKLEVFGPDVELVAKLKPVNTFIWYGNPDAPKPLYDLYYFREKIGRPTLTATLDSNVIVLKEKTPGLFSNKAWLWAVIAVVMGVLGFFTIRMMRTNSNN